MKIAFDALPLVSERITGIGWCEAGQTTAIYIIFFHRKMIHRKLNA